jgi:hypothetical protein
LIGGAVMCLAFNVRTSTKDFDAYFEPAKTIREAAVRIANRESYPIDWTKYYPVEQIPEKTLCALEEIFEA